MRLQLPTVALAAGWPLASQAAVIAGRGDLMPWITAAMVAALAVLAALAARRPAAWMAALAAAGLAYALARLAPAAMLFAPPVVIHFALGAMFASTLRKSGEPMISRYARRERGGSLEADLAAYTRRLTAWWAALFFAMGTTAAALAIAGSLAAWSLFANVVAYAIVLVFLAGEHAYRRVRFRHYRHAALGEFLRAVAGGLPPAARR